MTTTLHRYATMTSDEVTKTVKEIEAELLAVKGSQSNNLSFLIRDLGFPEHTMIHAGAKEIAAYYAAWVVFHDRMNRGE